MRGLVKLVFALAAISVILGCSSSGAAPTTAANPKVDPSFKADPDFIVATEFDHQGFRDAYDIVQRLRPNWFTRKTGGSAARRMGTAGSGLVVYLDNARMGGVDALRQLQTGAIESLRFLDAANATARLPGLGSSVISGAIVVQSRRSF
jgi:hypothetical protein